MTKAHLDAVMRATERGFAFPTTLERDPPAGGLAPQTPKLLMKNALLTGQPPDAFCTALSAMTARQLA